MALEKETSAYIERVLLAVAVRYGKDSDEYERTGGRRRSERRRSGLTVAPTG
ncbi:MAG: hypothetical protein AAFY78_15360 [Cyanobacteria bacterium J06648_16]